MKYLSLLPLLFSVFFLFPKNIFAAISLEISNLSTSIETNQEFSADIVFTCSGCGTSYLRGVFFYPESSTSYFGFTQNNASEWINLSGSPTSYFKIESGSWTGQMKFKFDSTKPIGDYYFKLGRYTASGTSFSQVSENKLINIFDSSPSITLSPTPTATETSTPTPTPTLSKSIYKINKSQDQNGQILTSVKIYIDNQYTHHEDDETFEFCDTCYCDNDKTIPCAIGQHRIKLIKSGYSDWSELRNINLGTNYEISPILTKIIESTPTPTSSPTSTNTPTPTPTKTPTLTIKTLQASSSSSFSAVLAESTSSASISAITDDSLGLSTIKNKKAPLSYKTSFFLGLFIAVSSGGLLYFRHRKD